MKHWWSGVQADYKDWGNQMRDAIVDPRTAFPHRLFDGTSTYRDEFIRRAAHPVHKRAPVGLSPDQPLNGLTTYMSEYYEKPISDQLNACGGRPWMNCDSCKPSAPPTPDGLARPGSAEKAWSKPPFAIGKSKLDGRTQYRTSYLKW